MNELPKSMRSKQHNYQRSRNYKDRKLDQVHPTLLIFSLLPLFFSHQLVFLPALFQQHNLDFLLLFQFGLSPSSTEARFFSA
jgi:hypothetical protein